MAEKWKLLARKDVCRNCRSGRHRQSEAARNFSRSARLGEMPMPTIRTGDNRGGQSRPDVQNLIKAPALGSRLLCLDWASESRPHMAQSGHWFYVPGCPL